MNVPWNYTGTTVTLAIPHTRIVYTLVKVRHPHWTAGLPDYQGVWMWQIWLCDGRRGMISSKDDGGVVFASHTSPGGCKRARMASQEHHHTDNASQTSQDDQEGQENGREHPQTVCDDLSSPEGFQTPPKGFGIMVLYRGSDPVYGRVQWATPTRWEAKAIVLRDILTYQEWKGSQWAWARTNIRLPLPPPSWLHVVNNLGEGISCNDTTCTGRISLL